MLGILRILGVLAVRLRRILGLVQRDVAGRGQGRKARHREVLRRLLYLLVKDLVWALLIKESLDLSACMGDRSILRDDHKLNLYLQLLHELRRKSYLVFILNKSPVNALKDSFLNKNSITFDRAHQVLKVILNEIYVSEPKSRVTLGVKL